MTREQRIARNIINRLGFHPEPATLAALVHITKLAIDREREHPGDGWRYALAAWDDALAAAADTPPVC